MQAPTQIALRVGIILSFLVAFLCLRKGLPLAADLTANFSAWLVGAVIHQWALKVGMNSSKAGSGWCTMSINKNS